MKKKLTFILSSIIFTTISNITFCQESNLTINQETASEEYLYSAKDNFKNTEKSKNSFPTYKFSISSPWHSFLNFGEEITNTQHYELHFKYRITPKDKIGIKLATWKLFQPLGIPILTAIEMNETEFYDGRIRENGIGVTYQRIIWKGIFGTVEILPQLKTYLDANNDKIQNGFKLYTSYHFGYHISLFNDRVFIEPQVHCQYWPIDSNTPQEFKEADNKWNNYLLFEPNIYIGVNF